MAQQQRLVDAAQQAVQLHASRSFARVATVRVVTVLVFLQLTFIFYLLETPGWAEYLAPLFVGAALAGLLAIFQDSRLAREAGAYSFTLDVLLVFELQRRALPTSPFPAGVAGFSLALFALLVTLCAQTMRRGPSLLVTVVAVVCEVCLMALAGVGVGPMLGAVVVLAILAWSQTSFARNLQTLVASLASSEIAVHVKQQRLAELETARATIERMLNEAQARHAELSGLQRDKDLLTALIVHDLRAPLGAIRANADFIRSELPTDADPELKDAATDVLGVTDRMAGMINDLLNISRLESNALPLNLEPVSVVDVVVALKRQLSAQARSRNIEVLTRADCQVVLDVDRVLLTRTLENLASNALRYTPSGGRISLEVALVGVEVELAVRNDGAPIPLTARGSLFDKFVQAGNASENRRAGWGLGLYFCKLCVDAHHGVIRVEDAPGWPTSFVVRLPAGASISGIRRAA
jgi:signal transduction histidine kinase